MSTKTEKLKSPTADAASTAKRSRTANGASAEKSAVRKESINERWIEKYGIDDSKSAKLLLRAWNKTYENRHKRID